MLRLALLAISMLLAAPLAAESLIVTSVNPIRALVREIVSDSFEVHSLVQNSANEHSAEITPQQAQDLAHADIIVLIGLGQEPWRESLPNASQSKILEFAHELNIKSGDQHLWLDPVMAANFIPKLLERLCQIKPNECSAYRQRSDAIKNELSQIDSELQLRFAALKQRSFIAFHPAWSRFAERYKLTVRATLTTSGDEEPSARTLLDLSKDARGIPIVVEPSTPTQMIMAISKELNSPIVTLDPQSDSEASYTQFLRLSSERLLNAMQEHS